MYFKYITILILKLLMFPVSVVLFPLAYPFRKKAYKYTEIHGLIGFHPLQWCSWFFTKYCNEGDWYTGPFWYMREFKIKHFDIFSGVNNDDPIPQTFKQRLLYFYLAYRWGALRIYMWNLNRELFKEGGIWDGLEIKTKNVVKHKLKIEPLRISPVVTPQLKYTNIDGTSVGNKGKYILYPGNYNYPIQICTLEGIHFGKFKTVRKNKNRFNFRYVTLKKIGRLLVQIEIFQGWSYYAGWPEYSFKIKFNKMNEKALGDYLEYQARLNLINLK